ncbi:Retrovirus-related Pol polyprotein from transposon 17.6, partial [Mucuna pruriens]
MGRSEYVLTIGISIERALRTTSRCPILTDPDGSIRQRKDHLHHYIGDILLQSEPFRLKNVRATYQRAMVTLFHDMMHKEVQVYVDDMIPKLRMPDQHVKDLRKLFERLQKYKLRLNPTKCTFGVKTGKLLGFIVSERRIEVDSDKVKAIQNMLAPKTKTEECQEAFEKVKQYLETPLVLVSEIPRKPLILYLTVLEESMGCILGQQDASRKKEQIIYYLSEKFTDYEQRYPTLEQTCYALVWIAKRLRQYMLAYTTWLISKIDPHQKAIRGSVLAEQLAHHPLSDYQSLLHEFLDEHIMTMGETKLELDSAGWKLLFDGASNLLGNGIRAVLASQDGQCFPFSTRLGFDCTNNMAKYEACAMGIMMALEHQVKELKVFGDSALVIYQLRGE